MLQYISSKDIYQFIKIIREYFKVHQLQTVTANDLWAIIDKDNSSKLRDHTNPTYNIPNLKKLMHTWIKEMHYPVLKVIRNYHNNMVMMLQENHNILDRNQWWIPVTYTTQTELEFTDILPKLWLQPGVQNLIIEETVQKNEWIIANLQQAGYYRVNYDPTNWRLIIDYLNHEDYWKIDVLNRAQIIDNAYHLMTIQQLDYDIFLNLTNYLSQEMDYVAWYPMLKILEYLSPFLPLEESTPLKDHMLKILNKILANIKYEELEDEDYFTICLRQELAKWACILDDPYYKQLANTRLTQHLEDPVQNKLLSGWKEWTYCNGLNIASKITWLKFWNAYTKLSNNRMLHIISCSGGFANPNLQLNTKALKHVTKSFRLHECINLFYFVITMNEKDLDSTLANLGNHIVYCKNTSDDIIKVITVIINHLYFEYQLLKVLNFVNCNVNAKRHIAHIKHTILTREYYIKIHKMTFLKIIKNWI
ncbi:aminopeptidase N-like isoform X2 [Ooceraea biroi]|nr:aminopeptidase N-like isoform X2 [Ooceraea biroi]